MFKLVALCFVAGSVAAARPSPPPLFVRGHPVAAEPGPSQIALADVDGDRALDLVTKHLLARAVQVFLGDGAGAFRSPARQTMRLDFQPGATVLADVDGDRRVDLVVARRDEEHEYIHVFSSDGHGGFTTASRAYIVSAAARTYKPTIRPADVNEDGHLDLVTSNGRRAALEILLGDGRGGFRNPRVVALPPQELHTFEVADVNADRHADIVVVSRRSGDDESVLVVKTGNGTGAFVDAAAARPLGRAIRLSALADVGGDRRPDLVLTYARNRRLAVAQNVGGGAFADPLVIDLPKEAFHVRVADVGGDERPDLVVATVETEDQRFAGAVVVLIGTSTGFAPAAGSPFDVGPGAYDFALGDVNRDGRLDVAASSFEGSAVTLLLWHPPNADPPADESSAAETFR